MYLFLAEFRLFFTSNLLIIWILAFNPLFYSTFANSFVSSNETSESNLNYSAVNDSSDIEDLSPLVEFNSDIKGIRIKGDKDEKTIPFGKKIVLAGTHSSQISDLTIRQIYADKDETLEAKISNQSWYAVTGPFPVNEDVILIFDIESRVTNTERQDLISDFKKSFDLFRDDLFNTGINAEGSAIRDTLRPILLRNLPDYFDNYLTSEDITLKNLILDFFLSQDLTTLELLINTQENIKSQQGNLDRIKDELAELVIQNNVQKLYEQQKPFEDISFERDMSIIVGVKNESDILNVEGNRKRLPVLTDTLENLSNRVKDAVSTSIADYDSIQIKKDSTQLSETKQLEQLYQSTVEKIENTRLYSAISLQSGLQVKDIEHYAGFDISENYLFNGNSVSTLFTVNIYFKRVDYNEPPQTFKDRFSLSVGLGITTPNVNASSPVYFIGGGIRLNKIFRLNGGIAFYNSSEKGEFIYNESIGLSINFRFIGDLFEIFNGATTNFQQ